MAVEDARERPRVAQHRRVEVAQLRIDGRERRHRVPLAEHEQVLPGPRGIGDIDVDESAVVERDERDRRREGAAGVEALVDGVPALLERQQPDIGVLDRQQLEDALPQEVVVRGARRAQARAGRGGSQQEMSSAHSSW